MKAVEKYVGAFCFLILSKLEFQFCKRQGQSKVTSVTNLKNSQCLQKQIIRSVDTDCLFFFRILIHDILL